MIVVTQASDSESAEWDRFVVSNDESETYHLYEWRRIFEKVSAHRCVYLIARDSLGAVVGVLPLVQLKSWLFGNFFVSVPWFNYCGTLTDNETVRNELLQEAWSIAKSEGASHVELRHSAEFDIGLPFRDDKVSMRLVLPETPEELWQGFPSKLRAQIRRPTKAGATSEDGGIELLDEFYTVFSRNMRDLGTPVFPKSLFQEIFDSFPDTTRIFVVRLDGKPCAAGFVHGFKDKLEIPSASSLREFNRLSVNMLLYWTVLEYAVRQGYSVFDFGRTTRDSGTYRFKKQWGALPRQLYWHYCTGSDAVPPALNPQNPKFRLATKAWRRLPLWIANSLGPAVVRLLP